jgi:hypothetical protein
MLSCSHTKKAPQKVYKKFNKKYERIVDVIIYNINYKIRDETNTYISYNKKEKIMSYNRSSFDLKPVSVSTLICLFFVPTTILQNQTA